MRMAASLDKAILKMRFAVFFSFLRKHKVSVESGRLHRLVEKYSDVEVAERILELKTTEHEGRLRYLLHRIDVSLGLPGQLVSRWLVLPARRFAEIFRGRH